MLIGDIVQYCSDPALGRLLGIIKRAFTIMEIVVPFVLMVALGIAFFTIVTNPDDKKARNRIYNAITAAVIVLLLPVVVNVVMYALNTEFKSKFVVSECWNASKVYEGSGEYHDHEQRGVNNYLTINPDEFVGGIDTDPNYRDDRVPDDSEDYEDGTASIYSDVVWDPKDVTKISNLNTIDFIKILKKHSKGKNFVPYAQDLIAAEHKYSVNVFFLTAVDAWESAWVTSPIAKSCNNLGGVVESKEHPSNGCGSNPGHNFASFSSVGEYIKYHAALLHKNYLTKGGAYYNGKSVESVRKRYCPDGDGGCSTWTKGVTSVANELFAQVRKITLTGSSRKAESIAKAAEYLAWPEGTPQSKYGRKQGGGPTPQFKKVYYELYPKYKNNSDASVRVGTCCCHFARTCVAYGLGQTKKNVMTFTLLPGSSSDEDTRKKMDALGFDRISFNGKVSSLKRGDVLYYRHSDGGHVWIYLGNNRKAEGAHDSGYAGRITKIKGDTISTSGKSVYYIFRARN